MSIGVYLSLSFQFEDHVQQSFSEIFVALNKSDAGKSLVTIQLYARILYARF
jgi:hypothetical protein